MRTHAPFPDLDEAIAKVRDRILWDLRDQNEIARNRWKDLVAGGGLGPATEARLLLGWAALVDQGAMERALPAAQAFEEMRVAGDLLDAAGGLGGPALGVLPDPEARYLGEWLIANGVRRLAGRGDTRLAAVAAEIAEELADGRHRILEYRNREDPWRDDPVSRGILHGCIEVKYGAPLRLACRLGMELAGAPEHILVVASEFGVAAGTALGIHVALTEGWDEPIQERERFRAWLVAEGKDAVAAADTHLGVLALQECAAAYVRQPMERWVEALGEALDALEKP